MFENIEIQKTHLLNYLGKAGVEHTDDPSNVFEHLENGIHIFQRTCNEMLVIWDHGNFET